MSIQSFYISLRDDVGDDLHPAGHHEHKEDREEHLEIG